MAQESAAQPGRKMKLHQAVATEKALKPEAYKILTRLYQLAQKQDQFSGMQGVYAPKTEQDEQLPPERKAVEQSVTDVVRQAISALIEPYDMTATVARGNQHATADLEVDGRVILQDMPVQFYLFVEKQILDVKNFIEALPTLDPAEIWSPPDANSGCYRAQPTQTVRTKKLPKTITKAEATKEHAAQVEIYHEDVPVGTWTRTKMSSALPVTEKRELLRRINALMVAVKQARELANSHEVEKQRVAAKLFDYIFAPVAKTEGNGGAA